MRATRAFRLIVLAMACAVAIVAGDAVGRVEGWLRRRAAWRRLRRWRKIRAHRAEWERLGRDLRRYQCFCECHQTRATCCPACKEQP